MTCCILNLFYWMCLNYNNFMKRLHLSHRVFWKAAQHFTGKNLSTFVPLENFFVIPKRFKSEMFIQESGYRSGLISKDKAHKNMPVSPFLPGANSRVDHWLYPGKTCSLYRKDAITWSFNEFKMVLAVPVRENRGILRCLLIGFVHL